MVMMEPQDEGYCRCVAQGTSMPINIPALAGRMVAAADASDHIHGATFVPPHLIEQQKVRFSRLSLLSPASLCRAIAVVQLYIIPIHADHASSMKMRLCEYRAPHELQSCQGWLPMNVALLFLQHW